MLLPGVLKHCKLQYKMNLTRKNPTVFQHFNASCAEIIDFTIQNVTQPSIRSQGYAAKVTQPRLRPRLHSRASTAKVTQPRLRPLLHIQGCIAKVTQPRIRSQGYAAKVTQPRLRPKLRSQACTAKVTSATVTLPRSSCQDYTSKVA